MLIRLAAIALALVATATATAEIVHLKSGATIEGQIISKDAEKIVIRVGERIRENREIPVAEIDRIETVSPDKPAYEKLRNTPAAGDLLSPTDYTALLAAPNEFLKEFPDSEYATEVKKMVANLEEEKAKVEEGSVKLKGEWITAEIIARDPFNHEASVLKHKFDEKVKSAAKSDDYVEALTIFSKLSEDYSQSVAYADSIATAIKTMDAYELALKRLESQHERETTRRQEQLNTRPANERADIEATFQRQIIAPFQSKWERAKDKDAKWLPVSVWSMESIDEAEKNLDRERQRVSRLDAAKLKDGTRHVADATQHIADKKFEEAEASLTKAQGSVGYGKRLQDLQNMLNDGRRKAMEEAEEARRKAQDEAVATDVGTMLGADSGKAEDSTETNTSETDKKPEDTGASDSSSPPPTTDDEEPLEEEGGIPPWMFILGLALVMGLVTVFLKKRNSDDEDDE